MMWMSATRAARVEQVVEQRCGDVVGQVAYHAIGTIGPIGPIGTVGDEGGQIRRQHVRTVDLHAR